MDHRINKIRGKEIESEKKDYPHGKSVVGIAMRESEKHPSMLEDDDTPYKGKILSQKEIEDKLNSGISSQKEFDDLLEMTYVHPWKEIGPLRMRIEDYGEEKGYF